MNFLTNQRDIAAWLEDSDVTISPYSVRSDGTVDVRGSVDMPDLQLKKIPIQFGRVDGNFDCSDNSLRSLAGVPAYARTINIGYSMSIRSLIGIQNLIEHMEEFWLHGCSIREGGLGLLLIDGLRHIDFNENDVGAEALKIISDHILTKDIFACQQALIEAGFEEYARL